MYMWITANALAFVSFFAVPASPGWNDLDILRTSPEALTPKIVLVSRHYRKDGCQGVRCDDNSEESDDDAGNDAQRRLADAENALLDSAERMRETFRQELQPQEKELTILQLNRNALLAQIGVAQKIRAEAEADPRFQADIDQQLENFRSALRTYEEDIAEFREDADYISLRTEHAKRFETTQRAISRVRDLRAALTPEGTENEVRGLLNAKSILGIMQSQITSLETKINDMRRKQLSDSVEFSDSDGVELSEAVSEFNQIGLDLAVLRSLLGATTGEAEDQAILQNTDLMSMQPETLDRERLAQLARVERDSELSRALARNGALMRVLTREAKDLRDLQRFASEQLDHARAELAYGENFDQDERLQLQTEFAISSGYVLAMFGQAELIEQRASEVATAFAEIDSLSQLFFQEDTRQALQDDPDDLAGSVQRVADFDDTRRTAVNVVMRRDLNALLDDTWIDDVMFRFERDEDNIEGSQDAAQDASVQSKELEDNIEGSQDAAQDASVQSKELNADTLMQSVSEGIILENLSDETREEPGGTAQELQDDARARKDEIKEALQEQRDDVRALLLAYNVSEPTVAMSSNTVGFEAEILFLLAARHNLEARFNNTEIELVSARATADTIAGSNRALSVLQGARQTNLQRLGTLYEMQNILSALRQENQATQP